VRADLDAEFAVDTVALDVDGVLVDVRESFREVVRATTLEMQRRLQVAQPWHPAQEDVAVFKRAGGFNDDVDLSIALTAIGAGGRASDAHRIARDAELAGGGLPALRIVAPDLPRITGRDVLRVFDELYWGSGAGEGTDPVAAEDGLINREHAMVGRGFPDELRAAGARAVALITGRTPRELDAALLRLGWRRDQLCHIVTGDMVRKPDPACLDGVEHLCAALSVVYVGDVRDDWELVRRWRQERPDAIATRCILVGEDGEMEGYRRLGVDATVRFTSDVPHVLRGWKRSRPATAR
jgi:phosphoglycolate phosphatase-like HAD superfamily hydrolase